jgi:hypothetical protein
LPDKIRADQHEDCKEEAINPDTLEEVQEFKQDERMGRVDKGEVVSDIILDIIKDIGILILIECVYCPHIYTVIPSGAGARYHRKKHIGRYKEKDPAQNDIGDFPELFLN